MVNGRRYRVGQKYYPTDDHCFSCTCGPKPVVCSVQSCEPPPCSNATKEPGTCCDFKCPGEGN